MIEAIRKGDGVQRANAICDDCGREEVVSCDYERRAGGEWVPNEGQIVGKLERGQNWALVKGKLRCPSCEAKRKAHKEPKKVENVAKANVEPIRKPDGKQKRLIVLALEDAYDDAAKRYKGEATDKTLAAELGGGVMPGWVAQIREEMFGPAGNEELDRVREDIAALERETRKLAETFASEQAKKIAALSARVDALVKSHDKRVSQK